MTNCPDSQDPLPPRLACPWAYKWSALAIASLGNLITTLDGGTVSIALPSLADTFQVDPAIVGWVGIAYFLTSTSLLLAMGWVGDFLGKERLYLIGIIVFTLSLGLTSVTQNIGQLIAMRAVQGIGSAMILPTSAAIIADAFPDRERGLAFGLTGAVVGLGLGAGPPLGGVLLDLMDWRALFYIRIPLGLLTLVLGWLVLRRVRPLPGPLHVDLQGTLLLLALLGSFLLAVNQAGRLGITSTLVLVSGTASLVLVPVFVFSQLRARRPIVELRLLRKPAFASGLAAILAHFQAWNTVGFLMPFVMIRGLGYSALKAGVILSVFSLVRTFASPVSGWLSDRTGQNRLFMVLGMIGMAGALVLLSGLGASATTAQFVGILAIASLGSALFDPPNASTIMSAVPRERLGMAGAAIATSRQIGLSSGIALSGAILTAREARYLTLGYAASDALISGGSDALVVSAVICVLGTLPLLLGSRWKQVAVD